MTAEYEKSLLNLLMHEVSFKRDLGRIPTTLFPSPANQQVLSLLTAYVQQFGQLPYEVNLIEYWTTMASTAQRTVDHTYLQQVIKAIKDAYEFTAYEPTSVKETLDGEIMRAKMVAIISEMSKPIHTAISTEMPAVLKELSTKIATMGTSDEKIKSAGYLKDRPIPDKSYNPPIYATFLSGINQIRSRGGFHAPNSVVFMGGPKSYKTTFLIAFAMQFAGSGLKVYYADAENGHISIEDRCRQHATGLTMQELYSDVNAEYITNRMAAWWQNGGGIKVDSYLKGSCTITDVKYRLEELRAVDGYVPHVIIYDYLDEWIPSSTYDRRNDRRLQIQTVYNEADALNNELDMFYFTVSPQNRDGGVAEDYKKLYNCWSSFELVQNPYEEEIGVVRIVSVGQREGIKNGLVVVKVDAERQQISQMNQTDWELHKLECQHRGYPIEGKSNKKSRR